MIDGVEILHGCEINVLNGGRLSLEQKYIDRLDYAIVGIPWAVLPERRH